MAEKLVQRLTARPEDAPALFAALRHAPAPLEEILHRDLLLRLRLAAVCPQIDPTETAAEAIALYLDLAYVSRFDPLLERLRDALAALPPDATLPTLVAALPSAHSRVQCWIVAALGQNPHLPESAVAALVREVKRPSWTTQLAALDALGRQRPLSAMGLTGVLRGLKHRNWEMRHAAVQALGRQTALPEEAVAALEAAQRDGDFRVRRAAATALSGATPEDETPTVAPPHSADIETLLREIDAPDYAVQNAAWVALWDASP